MMTDLGKLFFSNAFFDLAIIGTVGSALFLLVQYLLPDEQQAEIRRRLGVVERSAVPQDTPLLKRLHPFYNAIAPLLYVNAAPDIWLTYLNKKKKRYNHKLIAANLRQEISPDEFIALKFVMSFLFTLLIWAAAYALYIETTAVHAGICLILGFFLPDIWLKEKTNHRRSQIIRALPYSMDLLTLSVESGLDFISAISRMTQKADDNELHREFKQMLREIRLGTSRSDALRKLAQRLQVEEVTSLSSLLVQTDQLGASVGQILRAQSEQLRTKRFQAAEIAGARASQLILFPLIFCILPAAILVLLGPAALNFLRGGLI